MSRVAFFKDFDWEPWKNGQGLTRVLAGDTGWRLSLAEIRTSSSFSIFGGQTREIGLMQGYGITLQPDDPALAAIVLDETGVCFRFSGDVPLTGQLHDGPVQVLNLMYGVERHALRPITQAGTVTNLLALVPVRGVWCAKAERQPEMSVAAETSFLRFSTPQDMELVPQEGAVSLAYGVFAVSGEET
ncbi:HutD/Ves family protein [Acetobacter sp.]|uniref:HutD/Ves family protein n=1 Tax=Acetobacter sp. TaxID=440 RepID=UPI0025C1D846|nr:HutD family protein [Acetobacter sp.]MCH4089784.1 HutD family protein [Acetobacter sp.]MCI1298480.1 HutD family protein [Acetobacter sp.]